jgi:hypothetical protein
MTTYATHMAAQLLHDVTASGPFDAHAAAVAIIKQVLEDAAKAVITCDSGGCEDEECIVEHRAAGRVRALADREVTPGEGPSRG